MSLNGTLKALSDPIRRNILTMLKGKKMIAGEIAEELGISPASLSYHLNLLKKNDLVIESKEKNYACTFAVAHSDYFRIYILYE